MKNKLLIAALLLLFFSCAGRYSVKVINGQQCIHLFRNFYFKLNPDAILSYYSGNANGVHWSKFSFHQDDFANVRVYFSAEKKSKDDLARLNSNLAEEVKKNFNIPAQFKPGYFEELNGLNSVSFVNHYDHSSKVEAVNGSWQKGYQWIDAGASTEVRVYFVRQRLLMDYEIIIEYLPRLETKKDAEKEFTEEGDRIAGLVKSLVY